MLVDEAMHAALAAVGLPGAVLSAPIGGVVSPIHRAIENHCWFATGEGSDPVFVKRRHDDMAAFITPEHVAEASGKAGELGIAPRLLHADPASGILVFEALGTEWAWGHIDVLRRPAILETCCWQSGPSTKPHLFRKHAAFSTLLQTIASWPMQRT